MVCAFPQFRLIGTDTYHLALLAWTLGVPAVLIYTKDYNIDIGVDNGGIHFELEGQEGPAILNSQYEATNS